MKRKIEQCGIFLVVASVFAILYGVTAQRGVSWQDSALFQMRSLTGDVHFVFGLALAHPLYIWLGHVFVGLFAPEHQFFALNWMSGLGMAFALGLLAVIVVRLTKKRSAACLAVLTLGLSQMGWWMSTIAEVYTWSLAFLFLEIVLVIQICDAPAGKTTRYWLLLAFVSGLHAAVHNFALLNLPVYAALYLFGEERRNLRQHLFLGLAGLGCWLTGAGLLVDLFFLEWRTSQDLFATIRSWLFGFSFEKNVLGTGLTVGLHMIVMNWALAGVSLLNPGWSFLLVGLRIPLACRLKRTLLALTGVHLFFWIRYFVPDQATFVLPTLGLLAVWVGVGYASRAYTRKTHVLLGLVIVALSVMVPLGGVWMLAQKPAVVQRNRQLPFRDEMRYWLIPWKQDENSASLFAEKAASILKATDIVIADNTAAGPLVAWQAHGKIAKQVRVITSYTGESDEELVDLINKKRVVYVVSPVPGYTPDVILKNRQFESEGVLYRVR